MARAPYPDIETLPDELRTFVKRFDPLMNVFHMLAHTGPALPHFMRLGNAILFKGRLDPELREIAILRVGHLLGAPYEVHQHKIVSRNIGMDEARILAVKHGEDETVFSDLENLVIRFTDEVVSSVRASDATWNALSAKLDSGQMAELTLAVGFYSMIAVFLENFEVEIEPEGVVEDPMKRPRKAGEARPA